MLVSMTSIFTQPTRCTSSFSASRQRMLVTGSSPCIHQVGRDLPFVAALTIVTQSSPLLSRAGLVFNIWYLIYYNAKVGYLFAFLELMLTLSGRSPATCPPLGRSSRRSSPAAVGFLKFYFHNYFERRVDHLQIHDPSADSVKVGRRAPLQPSAFPRHDGSTPPQHISLDYALPPGALFDSGEESLLRAIRPAMASACEACRLRQCGSKEAELGSFAFTSDMLGEGRDISALISTKVFKEQRVMSVDIQIVPMLSPDDLGYGPRLVSHVT